MSESAMEQRTPEVSVIVPVLDEGGSIRELYERASKHLRSLGVGYEIIFVDDGSRDDTSSILGDICAADPAVGYIRHFRNHGKSMALMQGFDAARGAIAVTMDGDLQDEPENIGLLVDTLKKGGFDLVNGCRKGRRDNPARKFVSRVFNILVRIIFRPPVRDVNSGMKAYSRALYKRLNLRGDLHRLIPVIAANDGFKVTEVPVSHSPRRSGKSKYKLLRYRGLLDIVSLMAIQSTQLRPFHVFGGIGAVVAVAGVLAFVALIPVASGGVGLPALLLALCAQALFLVGVFLIFVGLLAEMLATTAQDSAWREKWIRERRLPSEREETRE